MGVRDGYSSPGHLPVTAPGLEKQRKMGWESVEMGGVSLKIL